MTTCCFNIEFRDLPRNEKIVVYNNRTIAKILRDGTMLADVREVRRNTAVFESLNVSRAMFLVEREEHAEDILLWSKLGDFHKLTLNCFFLMTASWLINVLEHAAPGLQNLTELEISGPIKIDQESFDKIAAIFPNMVSIQILGRSIER